MNFMNAVKERLTDGENNVSVTENGAKGYKTTGKALLDLNFSLSSLRTAPEKEIEARFADALAEDPDLAIVWLFAARDARGGMGERRVFRVCFNYLVREFPQKASRVAPLIPEYGRWDDLLDAFFSAGSAAMQNTLFTIIGNQLNSDLASAMIGHPVSLLGKWLPSENASSKETRRKAQRIMNLLDLTPKRYRQILSALRSRIDVVERRMSAGDWQGINYSAVPSRANLIYRGAFLTHDRARREEFLESLKKDPSMIKASVLFPHEIVTAYMDKRSFYTRDLPAPDDALEALWNNLPNVVPTDANIMVVADGSGSMYDRVSGSTTALDVANALAIYFAGKLSPAYRDRYITFSEYPEYVDLSGASTLLGKLNIALYHDEIANTNIERVFDLILDTAVTNHLSQQDLPDTILIISDGEFDMQVDGNPDAALFDELIRRFEEKGYQMPHLAFWNVCSRTGTVPVLSNPLGVTLVSGFSPVVINMVLSGELDPYKAMVSMLDSDRYDMVRDALKGV